MELMSPKINVRDIVSRHLLTLYDARQQEGSGDASRRPLYWLDVVTFFLGPLVIAFVVVLLVAWPPELLSSAITMLGVLGGLLFNLQVLTLEQARRLQREIAGMSSAHSARKRGLLASTQELLYNISFEILVSVVALAVSLIIYLLPEVGFVTHLARILLIWLLGVFLLGLLLVLKRSHYLVVGVGD